MTPIPANNNTKAPHGVEHHFAADGAFRRVINRLPEQ
jgi:hypothetical protein